MDRLVVTPKDRFWFPEVYARDEWVKMQAAKLAAGSKVLDAGAGASKYRPCFAHCDYKTQDFCAYEGPLVKYLQPIDYVCDITAIPLPDQSLDAILCTEVIEHLTDPMAALAEFNRLLKPDGRLLLTAPLLSHLHMQPYHFYGGFTQYWYQHWLPRKGFRVESMTAVGGPGRSCVVFSQAFYALWAAAEPRLPWYRRLISLAFRMQAKLLFHGLLPRVLPRFDRWLGTEIVCSSYLVAAVKKPGML